MHGLIGHANTMVDQEVKEAVDAIDKFMAHWRDEMGKDVYPKLHHLETHCVYTLRKIKTGFGVISEQGVEALHRVIKNIWKAFAIKKQDDALMFVLENLCLRTLVQMRKDGFMDF